MRIDPFKATTWGFCHNCNGYVCGEKCKDCVPIEQWCDNLESGRPANYKPVRVAVQKAIKKQLILP